MLAFLSIAPQLLIISLLSYATSIMGLNHFFELHIVTNMVGCVISVVSLGIGSLAIFFCIYLSIERKLFDILYDNPKSGQVLDNTIRYFWKSHKEGMTLEDRWKGVRKIYFGAIVLCIIQWFLTLLGFCLMIVGAK